MSQALELGRLVDVAALRDMLGACARAFGVPIRLFSATGALVAEHGALPALCELVGQAEPGRRGCRAIVADVKRTAASADAPCAISCFTGARYDVLPLTHQGNDGGRLVIGPYLRTQGDAGSPARHLPASLLQVAAGIDETEAQARLAHMPSLGEGRADDLKLQLKRALEMVLAAGYERLAASEMHLSATRSSFRELNELRAEVKAARDRLRELESLKQSFLSTVSHELRTPLTSIIGYGDMLTSGLAGELAPEQREYVEIIQQQSDQLLELITTLLDISSLHDGTIELHPRRVNIFDVLREAVRVVTPKAVDLGVFVDIERDDSVPELVVDPDRIRQVFVNLLDNAIKFSAAGGYVTLSATNVTQVEEGTIGYILLAPVRRQVRLSVKDEGPGVPDHEKARIFDAFYQVDHRHTREHSGSGLGLSIVKELVEAHHGAVTVQDNTPHGAAFVVTLPLAAT